MSGEVCAEPQSKVSEVEPYGGSEHQGPILGPDTQHQPVVWGKPQNESHGAQPVLKVEPVGCFARGKADARACGQVGGAAEAVRLRQDSGNIFRRAQSRAPRRLPAPKQKLLRQIDIDARMLGHAPSLRALG